MPDEAAGTWIEMADGLSLGHRLLTSVLGPAAVPRVGWQIDPFGHSAVSPGRRERRGPPCPFPSPPPPSDDGHCLHAHGRPVRHVRAACPGILPLHSHSLPPPFLRRRPTGRFYGRLDMEERALRWNTSASEYVWRPSRTLGRAQGSLAGFNINGYDPPKLPSDPQGRSPFYFDIAQDSRNVLYGPFQVRQERRGFVSRLIRSPIGSPHPAAAAPSAAAAGQPGLGGRQHGPLRRGDARDRIRPRGAHPARRRRHRSRRVAVRHRVRRRGGDGGSCTVHVAWQFGTE